MSYPISMQANISSVLLILVSLISLRVHAADDHSYFERFESPFMEILNESRETKSNYPWWAKVIQSDLLKIDPSGNSEPVSKACDPGLLTMTRQDSLEVIKDYFGRCESELETFWKDIVSNTYMTVFLKMSPSKHPFAQHVMFHLPGGVNLKGLLGLKGDGIKRPLVILRLGIFSNTIEFFPERYLFMQLFEQSPFNILLLESLSGSEYIEHNDKFSLGGFDEGIQNFWIARQLQNPTEPLSRLIDSVHMTGVSMGAHGIFFAAILNQLNDKPISSFLAFCPLVNFAETFNFQKVQPWTFKAMNLWSNARLPRLRQMFPSVSQANFVSDVVEALKVQPSTWIADYNVLRWPRNMVRESFAERLSFWSEFKDVETPFLIFATKKDPIVPYALNSEKLLNKEINLGRSNLEVIPLEQGYHCSLPAAYNWKAFATILQKYIKTHSKQWVAQPDSVKMDFPIPPGSRVDWEVDSNSANLVVGTWSNYRKQEFPLDRLNAYKFSRPFSEEDQSLIRRWLFQNVKILNPLRPKGQDTLSRTELVWEY